MNRYLNQCQLKIKVEALAETALKGSVTSYGHAILLLKPDDLPVVCRVLNEIGVEERYANLVFRFCERTLPGENAFAVLITPLQKKEKIDLNSYAWVEQSSITGKWLVMAMPPGAVRPLSLCVYQDYDKALGVACTYEHLVGRMPLKDWESKRRSFLNLLSKLPKDDDEIVGMLTPQGKVELFL